MNWKREIEELHDFFESYLGGPETSLARAERVLDDSFVIIGPEGDRRNRTETLAALTDGQGKVAGLVIKTTDHHLIHEANDLVIAGYIERQWVGDDATKRWSTATFQANPGTPNGLTWLHLHETWTNEPDPAS